MSRMSKRSADAVQHDLLERIRTEGVEAAYEASLAVCRDTKAPAPARATASATLFRVAGYFDRQQDHGEKQPHEMTGEELAAAVDEITGKLQPGAAHDVDLDAAPDLFG